jgi:hypothetical protein
MKKSNIIFAVALLTISTASLAAGSQAGTTINNLINSVTDILRSISLGVIVLALTAGAISHMIFHNPVSQWLKPVLIGGGIAAAASQIGNMLTSTGSAGF